MNAQVVVRSVKLSYRASYPDLVQYAIAFANDWADDLAIKTSATVPADAWLPAADFADLSCQSERTLDYRNDRRQQSPSTPEPQPRAAADSRFAGATTASCRATDPDLVMRGSQPTMTFTRASASDRFYIRMYDGSNPPNYSEFSAALIFNLPLGFVESIRRPMTEQSRQDANDE